MSQLRRYESSHPQLTFEVDVRRVDATLWLLLGEAQSKCDHISGVPLRPAVANHLHRLYLVKGVQATTAIEGNTLTEHEIERVLQGTLHLPQSKEYLAQEVKNIAEACEIVVRDLQAAGDIPLTVERIRLFNRAVLLGLELPEHVTPGETRTYPVGVGGYRAAPAEDCDFLLDRLVAWLNGDTFKAPTAELAIVYALIRAVLAHLYIAWIHPFGDGNGRTARLIELQILLAAGAPTPAAHLLSNQYNQTRGESYRQLERSGATKGDVVPFLEYAIRGFVDGLRSQLDVIREQQLEVAWRSYVHEVFDGLDSPVEIRRRHLVLDLAAAGPTPLPRVREVSPRVAADYAKVTSRAITRDLDMLIGRRLVVLKDGAFAADTALIQAFLPIRRIVPAP